MRHQPAVTRKRTFAGERIQFVEHAALMMVQQGRSRCQGQAPPRATFGHGQSAAFGAISSATFHGPSHAPPIMPTGWNSVGRLARHPLLIRARTCRQALRENWMLGWFQALMPKEARFFDLFEKHAQTLIAGSRHLRAVLDGGAGLSENCAHVSVAEEAADTITREVIVAVRRDFHNPLRPRRHTGPYHVDG